MTDITFFVSPNGMGHVTRDVAISHYLHDFSTKFVTSNAAAEYLKQIGYSVKKVTDSPKFVVKDGEIKRPNKWLWDFCMYHKEYKNIAERVVKEEKPQIIISDEDYASLVVAQKQNIPSILVTNILETRFTSGVFSIFEKIVNRNMRNITKKCDIVILPAEGQDHDNLRYVGPIVRTINNSREELRKRFSFNKKTIVISLGGTYDSKFFFEKILQVSTKIKEDVEWAVVSGPIMNKHYEENMRDLECTNNLHEIIFAADLIISLAGSSTISESKTYGTPGIFIPIKGHFEHEDSAKKEGFTHDDINRLESLIIEKLDEKRNPQKNEGAKKASEIIRSFIS